ncbi:MAG: DUF29 domain-containing protein [Methylovulum sp.]|nr:DUF29 domain-containing protein [Methylovulum sp.]MCF8007150.1 DUF29 domain-containing protein [Methylovulum sp.]
MKTTYEHDIIAWAYEQAHFLRTRQFSCLDVSHIAEEIEDVGKSEQRELASRMAVLLAHLLKWEFQPQRRGFSWETTIHTQRNSINRRIRKTPSLKASLSDDDWWADAWDDAVAAAAQETGLAFAIFPKNCPWPMEQIMSEDFFPNPIEENAR